MLLARPAACPIGAERALAVAAEHEAPEREIGTCVFAKGGDGLAGQPLLNALERLQVDQRLMPALHHADAPGRVVDIAGIDDAGQQVLHPLLPHGTMPVARIGGKTFEEAHDFGLRLEPAGGVTLKRLLHDRGQRLVADDDLPRAFRLLEAIANGALEDPEAATEPRLHTVQRLLRILAALVLGDGRANVLG
ncbi:MAG: hypothetical protein AAF577_10045 [Pseudomonadota bacterium]